MPLMPTKLQLVLRALKIKPPSSSTHITQAPTIDDKDPEEREAIKATIPDLVVGPRALPECVRDTAMVNLTEGGHMAQLGPSMNGLGARLKPARELPERTPSSPMSSTASSASPKAPGGP